MPPWHVQMRTFITSQPVSSATIVGLLNGNVSMTPFSVPTHSELWAAVKQDTITGIRLERFSDPNTKKDNRKKQVSLITKPQM